MFSVITRQVVDTRSEASIVAASWRRPSWNIFQHCGGPSSPTSDALPLFLYFLVITDLLAVTSYEVRHQSLQSEHDSEFVSSANNPKIQCCLGNKLSCSD